MSKPTVLIIEDEHALASAMGASVTRLGALPKYAASGKMAIEALSAGAPSALVLDIGLPDMSGLEILKQVYPKGVPLPVLVVTAHGSLENAIAAKRLGVAEYLTKPLDLHAFEEVLGGLLRVPESAPKEDAAASGTTMIGASSSMQRVFREVAHACTTDVPVVIGGASGTGKTLAAHVIHANSGRGGTLRFLECGEAGEEDIAELIASQPSEGGGVLLENIDRLAPAAQAKLLAAVESGQVTRLFSTARTPLHDSVGAGNFREDLYYRLRGIEIRLPTLANRAEDIPALASYFLGRAGVDRVLEISEEALALLCERGWPGNVRELQSAIDYGVSVCGGSRLLPQHLPPDLDASGRVEGGGLEGAVGRWLESRLTGAGEMPRYAALLDELEAVVLTKLLRRYGGKPTYLASELGLNRTTLRKRLERLGIR